jgi:hypothetical protein
MDIVSKVKYVGIVYCNISDSGSFLNQNSTIWTNQIGFLLFRCNPETSIFRKWNNVFGYKYLHASSTYSGFLAAIRLVSVAGLSSPTHRRTKLKLIYDITDSSADTVY